MKPHLFTLLLRLALVEERIAEVQQRKNPNTLELLRLKALRMVIKERINRSRARSRAAIGLPRRLVAT
jgi:hypothetical protein